jgi:hypothetical protein
MRRLTISGLLAVVFSNSSFAQPIKIPELGAHPSLVVHTKSGKPSRPSSGAGPPEVISGIRARHKPSSGSRSANTSYSTITNAPPSAARNSAVRNSTQRVISNFSRGSRRNNGSQLDTSTTGMTSTRGLPESMRIQQETLRTLPPPADLITKGGTPAVVNSSVERNRIDPSAPTRLRLQIDNLSGVRAQQQNIGTPSNPSVPQVNGVSSSSGNSTGTSEMPLPTARAGSGTLSRPSSVFRSLGTRSRPSARSSSGGSR